MLHSVVFCYHTSLWLVRYIVVNILVKVQRSLASKKKSVIGLPEHNIILKLM